MYTSDMNPTIILNVDRVHSIIFTLNMDLRLRLLLGSGQ